MADTNIEKHFDEEIEEENDVVNISLDDSINAEKDTSIDELLEEPAEKKTAEIEPAFTNPIYTENQDSVAHTESEKVKEHFSEEKQPPLDRLLKQTTEVDVSYNAHSAIDRVLKFVEDTDSGDETAKLINGDQVKKPIDRTVASIRQNSTPNPKHPIDRVIVTATQDPSKATHPTADRISEKLKEEGPLNPRHPIDRLAGDYTTPNSMKRLLKTLSDEVEIPPAASSRPIDKLMRTALTENSVPSANPTSPLDKLVKATLHGESEYNSRRPIDRLTQTLTGKNIGADDNAATPLARLERTLTSK